MRYLRALLAAGLVMVSSRSFAIVDIQLTLGSDNATYKYKDDKGTAMQDLKQKGSSLGLNVFVSPWAAPFGLGLAYDTGGGTDSDSSFDYTMGYAKVSLAASAWIPLPKFRPFLNLKYVIASSEVLEAKANSVASGSTIGLDETWKGTLSGYSYEIGLAYKFFPTFNMFLEFSQNTDVFTLKSYENKTNTVTTTGDFTNGERFNISGTQIKLGFGLSL